MGVQTGYQIRCRGCHDKRFVDLKQKVDKGGEMGRFYYTDSKGCKHFDQFNPDIDNTDDLKDMVPGVVLKGPGEAVSIEGDSYREIPKETDPRPAGAPKPVEVLETDAVDVLPGGSDEERESKKGGWGFEW